jgi:hypothetical protein
MPGAVPDDQTPDVTLRGEDGGGASRRCLCRLRRRSEFPLLHPGVVEHRDVVPPTTGGHDCTMVYKVGAGAWNTGAEVSSSSSTSGWLMRLEPAMDASW